MSAGRPIRVDAPEIKPGQVITLAQAVAAIGARDQKVRESERNARERARKRIERAVAGGLLEQLPGGEFETDALVAWATTHYPNLRNTFPGFKIGPSIVESEFHM